MKKGVGVCLQRFQGYRFMAVILAALVILHIFARIGSFDFTTVFPWLFFLSLILGYTEGHGDWKSWLYRKPWRKRIRIAPFLGIAAAELLIEDILKCKDIASTLGTVSLVLLLYFIYCRIDYEKPDRLLAGGRFCLVSFLQRPTGPYLKDGDGRAGSFPGLRGPYCFIWSFLSAAG